MQRIPQKPKVIVNAKLCVSQDRLALLPYRTALYLRNLPDNMMTRSIQVQRKLVRDSNTKADNAELSG